MKLNFNERLKEYLLELMIREGEEEAWELLKTLSPDCNDLYNVIRNTKFWEEAWELFKQQSPTKNDLFCLVGEFDKSDEAVALLLKQPLDNKTLKKIVEVTKSDEAARMLLDQDPDNDQLEYIMRYSNLGEEAAARLLEQSPDNDSLVDIIQHSTLKNEAWEKLLQQSPTNAELINIIGYTDLEDQAWQQLLKQDPTNEELMDLVNDFGETGRKVTEAAALVLKQDPDIETLKWIIKFKPQPIADEAWELLKQKSPTCKQLEWLIWRGQGKMNEAAELSMKNNPTKEQLLEIMEYTDRKEAAAEMLVNMPLEMTDLVEIILATDNPKAVALLSERVQLDRSTIDEPKLVAEIKEKLQQNPELLNVNHWHEGETHCFGGWAIALSEAGQRIEKQFGPEAAACLLLPNHTDLFYADRETVLKALKDL